MNCSEELNFICQFGMPSPTNSTKALNLNTFYSYYVTLVFSSSPKILGHLSHVGEKMPHYNVALVKL